MNWAMGPISKRKDRQRYLCKPVLNIVATNSTHIHTVRTLWPAPTAVLNGDPNVTVRNSIVYTFLVVTCMMYIKLICIISYIKL